MQLPVAVLGALLWGAWWWSTEPLLITALLMFGPLVAIPLGLFGDQGVRSSWRDAAAALQLPAALALLVSVSQPAGWSATLLALPWLVITVLLTAHGLARLLPRDRHPPAELCIDAAYLFVLVGGVWAILDRMGAQPLGYTPLMVQLTAVHFHFAGFALPLLAGLLGRARPGGTPALVAAGVLAGIPLVAGGIVFSQLTGDGTGEWIASWTLALASGAVAVLQLQEARKRTDLARVLLALSGASLLVGMFMAAAYGFARAKGLPWPTIAHMIPLHGLVNALGFAGLGLVARALVPPDAPDHRAQPAGRGLWSRGAVGNGWFMLQDLADPSQPTPAGQIEQLSSMDSHDFAAAETHPEVQAFYEQTARYELWVRPRWPLLFALPARLYVALARSLGQLVLPLDRRGAWQQVKVRTFAADAALPMAGGRLYERRYANGTPMFIAAYGVAERDGQQYMAVSLPLPGTCLMGMLRPENMGDGGLRLRSRRADDPEAGLFLDTPVAPVRLPMSEDLLLGPLEQGFAPGPSDAVPGATIGAVHRFELWGIRCLELDYLIRPVT